LVAYVDGDNVLFDDTGLTQPDVSLGTGLMPGSIVVDTSGTYTFLTSPLTGDVPLIKRGTGLLILERNNQISSPASIEEGQLQLGIGGSTGNFGSGNITNNGTLIINRTGTRTYSNDLIGSGGLEVKSISGTISMLGNNTLTGPLVHSGGCILRFYLASQFGTPSAIQFHQYGNARVQLGGGITIPSSCPITVAPLTGSDRANVQCVEGGDAGPLTVDADISIGAGGDPLSNLVDLYAMSTTNEFIMNGSLVETDLPYTGRVTLRGNGVAGKLYGSIHLPSAQLLKDEASTWTIYSSGNSATNVVVNRGTLLLAAANALPNAPLTVGLNAGFAPTLDLGGFDQAVGSLSSVATVADGLITNSSATAAVLTLSDGGVSEATIADSGSTGRTGLHPLNPGSPNTQQLLGACTYSGPTTLDVATAISLVGSGDIPYSTPIQMANGSSIESRYKYDSTFTLGAAQTLIADGTVNIGGSFASLGTISLKVSKSGGTISADNIVIASGYSVAYGGTLYLDLSGDPLGGSDEIKLFTADSYSGSFSSIVPTTPGPGRTWDTSTLTTDGKLRVNSTLPTTPTTMTAAVVSGGTELQLGWPVGYTGWALQGQTNASGVGITTDWHYVPGSDQVNTVTIPIDPANSSVFFRMVLP